MHYAHQIPFKILQRLIFVKKLILVHYFCVQPIPLPRLIFVRSTNRFAVNQNPHEIQQQQQQQSVVESPADVQPSGYGYILPPSSETSSSSSSSSIPTDQQQWHQRPAAGPMIRVKPIPVSSRQRMSTTTATALLGPENAAGIYSSTTPDGSTTGDGGSRDGAENFDLYV